LKEDAMSLSKRQERAKHETVGVQKTGGVDPTLWWDFAPEQRVMTIDGVMGTVTAVLDGPYPGYEEYEVVLDHGLGGGSYTASQLREAGTVTASEHHLASDDYPEMGTILHERPDPAKKVF
jgi:hypothetical protein